MTSTDLLTHPARSMVAVYVRHYVSTLPGQRPSAVTPAHLAAWLLREIRGIPDLDALTAAISSAVWRPDPSSPHGWIRRQDLTEGELINAVLSAIPAPEPLPLILLDKPGLTGDSTGDLDRMAAWSRQEEALQRLSGKTVCLDFDATLHAYTHWTGLIPEGEPTPYARELCVALLDAGVRVVISSCRAAEDGGVGKAAIEGWLNRHEFPDGIEVTHLKPQAVAYIDDRAVPYRGTWLDCLEAAAALIGQPSWHQDEPVPPAAPAVDEPEHVPGAS